MPILSNVIKVTNASVTSLSLLGDTNLFACYGQTWMNEHLQRVIPC